MTGSPNRLTKDDIEARMGRVRLFCVPMWATDDYDPNGVADTELMRDHLRWQLALEDEGRLFAAGPFDYDRDRSLPIDQSRPIGMYIFAAASRAEAEAIAAEEPFARAGLRTYLVRSWLLNEGRAAPAGRGVAAAFGPSA